MVPMSIRIRIVDRKFCGCGQGESFMSIKCECQFGSNYVKEDCFANLWGWDLSRNPEKTPFMAVHLLLIPVQIPQFVSIVPHQSLLPPLQMAAAPLDQNPKLAHQ